MSWQPCDDEPGQVWRCGCGRFVQPIGHGAPAHLHKTARDIVIRRWLSCSERAGSLCRDIIQLSAPWLARRLPPSGPALRPPRRHPSGVRASQVCPHLSVYTPSKEGCETGSYVRTTTRRTVVKEGPPVV